MQAGLACSRMGVFQRHRCSREKKYSIRPSKGLARSSSRRLNPEVQRARTAPSQYIISPNAARTRRHLKQLSRENSGLYSALRAAVPAVLSIAVTSATLRVTPSRGCWGDRRGVPLRSGGKRAPIDAFCDRGSTFPLK